MKKLLSLLLCLLLLAVLPCPAFADYSTPGPIVDNADLLAADEEDELGNMATQIYSEYGIWTAIITVDSLGGKSAESYADDYYDNNYYAIYPDGVLLLIAMDTREWSISTCGRGIDLLTDYELDQLFFGMSGELSDNLFFDAFQIYLERLPQYMATAPETEPGVLDFLRILLISLLIGAAAGGITILIMRGQMNTAKAQKNAGSYLVSGSYQLKRHSDIFLYSRVSRTRKAENHGGGSSHRSSGGVRHGGRSGRF